MAQKFIKCNTCGTIINYIDEKATPVCCGEPMAEMELATEMAGTHAPAIVITGSKVKVTVGDGTHRMDPDHFIKWVSVESEGCVQRKELSRVDEVVDILFMVPKTDKVLSAHVFCNKHGLFKTEYVYPAE